MTSNLCSTFWSNHCFKLLKDNEYGSCKIWPPNDVIMQVPAAVVIMVTHVESMTKQKPCFPSRISMESSKKCLSVYSILAMEHGTCTDMEPVSLFNGFQQWIPWNAPSTLAVCRLNIYQYVPVIPTSVSILKPGELLYKSRSHLPDFADVASSH